MANTIKSIESNWNNPGITINPNSNTYKLLLAISQIYDEQITTIEDIRDSHHIATSTGRDLDKLGELVNTTRNDEENDRSASFPGQGSTVYVETGTDLGDPSEFSITFWLHPTALDETASNDFRNIIRSGSSTSFIIYEEDNSISFRVPGVATSNFKAGTVDLDEWTPVACVYDQSDRIIYVDGEEVGRETIGSGTVALNNLRIGGDGTNSVHTFAGYIDDVRAYTAALSGSQVADLADGEDVTTNLFARWTFNDGSDPTSDVAGSNDATMNGTGFVSESPEPISTGDERYRTRIKLRFKAALTGTSTDEFIQFMSTLLQTDPTNLELTYQFTARPGTVFVNTDASVYDALDFSIGDIEDLADDAVPAGHAVELQERGTFRLKEDGEPDDPSKGLTSDAISTGGTLSADLS